MPDLPCTLWRHAHTSLAVLLWVLLPFRAGAVRNHARWLQQPQGLGLDPVTGFWYWAEAGARKIRRANANFSTIEDVVVKDSDEEAPFDISLDTIDRKVYWTSNRSSVRRASMDDGTGEEILVNQTAGSLALDAEAGKLYFTCRTDGTIWRTNLNGTSPELVVNATGIEIWALALDLAKGKMYWADASIGQVLRANLNGSDPEAVHVSWANLTAYGLAVDTENEQIYITDNDVVDLNEGGVGRILRANLDGSNSTVLVSSQTLAEPFDIALDATTSSVYWTDREAGLIQSLTLFCKAGNLTVASRHNHSSVQMPHGAMSHGDSVPIPCPGGYTGTLRLVCNDGFISVSSGQCAAICPAGRYAQAPRIVDFHAAVVDGDIVTQPCLHGLVGSVQLSCEDGDITIVNTCRVMQNCTSTTLKLGYAKLESTTEMMHGDLTNVPCPSGFIGTGYDLECNDSKIEVLNGTCLPWCNAGHIWVDNGAVSVSHSAIRAGLTLKVICPQGSAGEGVELACVRDPIFNDYINVTTGSCTRDTLCHAGQKNVNGASVSYSTMDEGDRSMSSCPGGYTGDVNFTCSGGVATVIRGYCYAHCDSGAILDNSSLPVPYSAEAHGTTFFAMCPDGYHGVIPLVCRDGNVTIFCQNPQGCECVHIAAEANEITLTLLGLTVLLLLVIIMAICYHKICWREKFPHTIAKKSTTIRIIRRTMGRSTSSASTEEGAVEGYRPPEGYRSPEANGVIVCPIMPLPGYWATRDGVHIFPDPNRMNEVQQLMSDTWRGVYTRDRMMVAGDHRVPIGCRVANVLRIENHTSFERYATYKDKIVEARRHSLEPFSLMTDDRLAASPCDEECNEKYLFHGTNPESAHAIARDFFRIDKAGECRGSMFGPGIYLAENASKSDEYAKEGSGVYVGLCAMLLCRAVAGRVLTVDSAGDCSARVRSGEFDSVCGDRLAAAGTFREMVFFHGEAVYPEFIVIYARIYE
mmetsp:Transcript_1155/g.2854  ORF Transcript_1155/g.2854 Transcript_1155/m.2854 type:complete len:978 (+) Transcript_1155:55-2988(+)